MSMGHFAVETTDDFVITDPKILNVFTNMTATLSFLYKRPGITPHEARFWVLQTKALHPQLCAQRKMEKKACGGKAGADPRDFL